MDSLSLVVGVVVGLAAAWLLLIALLWLLRPRDVRAGALIRVVPDIVRLCRDLVVDRTTPLAVRIGIAGLLIWLVNPIDLIPEFIPVLGPLDDVVVAVFVLRHVRKRMGAVALRARWRGTSEGFELLQGVMG